VHKDRLTRTRRDPQDGKKFHLICDKCNECYIEKQLLGPYIKSVRKVKDIVSHRQADISGLEFVLQEVSGQVSSSQVKDYDKMTQEEQKEFDLSQEIAKLRANIKALDKTVDQLRDEEDMVNQNLMREEQYHSDKVKLMSEV